MMDGAYFTSRKEILDFLNTLLDLNLTKIEQTASGAVACQLTEYLFPNSIPMSRVDWGAKSSHEYVTNYKLLQNAFNKQKIRKHVDVDKLIRGKYQDNLEFCQWLKAFYDQTNGMMEKRVGYDPVAVRAKGKGGKGVERSKGGVVSKSTVRVSRTASTRGVSSGAVVKPPRAAVPASSSSRPTSSSSASRTTATARHKENIANTSSSTVPSKPRKTDDATKALQEENRQLQSQNAHLQSKITELEENLSQLEMNQHNIESERDFYFNKLRGIEIMLQVYKEKDENGECDLGEEAKRVIERAFRVMYATEEDPVEVDDEGNVSFDLLL
jgi:RP/EB family microtubule-associated protein